MPNDPMDMVVGASGASTVDAKASNELIAQGQKAFGEGDRVTAIEYFRKALSADPTHLDAAFKLAYVLDMSGEEDEALALYERVCENAPAPINALMNLGLCYIKAGDTAAATRIFHTVLRYAPGHDGALRFLAELR